MAGYPQRDEVLKGLRTAFGQPFIANPDLPERFYTNTPLNAPDPATFYPPGLEGYTDYLSLRCARNRGLQTFTIL